MVRLDRGMSYVEVLVSVILLGTAGVAVLGAAASAARGASTQRAVADSQIVLAAASDGLSGVTPVACAQALAEGALMRLRCGERCFERYFEDLRCDKQAGHAPAVGLALC